MTFSLSKRRLVPLLKGRNSRLPQPGPSVEDRGLRCNGEVMWLWLGCLGFPEVDFRSGLPLLHYCVNAVYVREIL